MFKTTSTVPQEHLCLEPRAVGEKSNYGEATVLPWNHLNWVVVTPFCCLGLQVILAQVPDMWVKDPPAISSSDPSQEISRQDNEWFLSAVHPKVWLEREELKKEIIRFKNWI